MRIYIAACDDDHLESFLTALSAGDGVGEVCLDFSRNPFLVPGAVLALLLKMEEWTKNGQRVYLSNYKNFTYLQRMDFFRFCSIPVKEKFQRHPTKGRFFPITRIADDTDLLARQFASCIVPDQAELWEPEKTGVYDIIWYAVTELANNVNQHSQGIGYCFLQKYLSRNILRIGIADNGIGIKRSLENTPYYRENDEDAISEALKVNVSGRAYKFSGESANAGVGLSLITEIAKETGGHYSIISGSGMVTPSAGKQMRCFFQGTICSFTFPLNNVINKSFNATLLQNAKIKLGLIKENTFGGLFI